MRVCDATADINFSIKDLNDTSFNYKHKTSNALKNCDIENDLRGFDTANFAAKNLQIERPRRKIRQLSAKIKKPPSRPTTLAY